MELFGQNLSASIVKDILSSHWVCYKPLERSIFVWKCILRIRQWPFRMFLVSYNASYCDAHLARDMDVFVTFYSAGAGGKCQIFIRCSGFPCVRWKMFWKLHWPENSECTSVYKVEFLCSYYRIMTSKGVTKGWAGLRGRSEKFSLRSKFITKMSTQISRFCGVTPFSLVVLYLRLGGSV